MLVLALNQGTSSAPLGHFLNFVEKGEVWHRTKCLSLLHAVEKVPEGRMRSLGNTLHTEIHA
jgi:hypothetical protein